MFNFLKNTNRRLIIAVIFFGILYSLIAFVNHYYFRTYALDLGAYTNALYDYAHFRWNDSLVFKESPENLLADHFDLYLPAFSLFSYITGTWTLLIIQILFILIGAIGVFTYITERFKNPGLAVAGALSLLLFYGVFSAVSFDYHSNVVSAMLIPWMFVFIQRRKIWLSAFSLLIIILGKENMALWTGFVCLGLWIEYRSDSLLKKVLPVFALFSFLSFFLITQIIMPAISVAGAYPHFQYSILGENFSRSFVQLIQHPLNSLQTLFINHNTDPSFDGVKTEVYWLLLLSGGYFLFLRPAYLLMLVPVIAQKMFHDNPAMWSLSGQYNIEFAPILAIGSCVVLAGLNNKKILNLLTLIFILGTGIATLRSMDRTVYFTNKNKIRFYQSGHYKRSYNVSAVHELLKSIPEQAVVSAQSPFLPHLSLRDKIYQFPLVKNADWIVYSLQEAPYPLDTAGLYKMHERMLADTSWNKVMETEDCFLFKRSTARD